MSGDVKRCHEMSRDVKRCRRCQEMPRDVRSQQSGAPNSQLTHNRILPFGLRLERTMSRVFNEGRWAVRGSKRLHRTNKSRPAQARASFSPKAGKPFSTFSLCSLYLVFIIVSYSERTMTSQKEPTVQTCPKKVVSTKDLCLAPLRC